MLSVYPFLSADSLIPVICTVFGKHSGRMIVERYTIKPCGAGSRDGVRHYCGNNW